MLKRVLVIIGILVLIGVLIWFIFFKDKKQTVTVNNQTAELKIPILLNPLQGVISATSTAVASPPVAQNAIPPDSSHTPKPISPAPVTLTPAPQNLPPALPVVYENREYGFRMTLPAGTVTAGSGSRLSFATDSQMPFGYIEVINRNGQSLEDLQKIIALSPDVFKNEYTTVGNKSAVFYQSANWQKNGLVIASGDRFYYIYGALLKHAIRDTIQFF